MISTVRLLVHLGSCFTAASLIAAASSVAIAADASSDASPWDDGGQSAARLIAARSENDSGERTFRAGVEIKLNEGWKTYWRYPGDSGVPPVLDFSKSDNVKAVTVLFPAPSRFPDGAGGHSIGYKGDIVWPVHVTPRDAAKPVKLNLKLDYATCEKLCVPEEAHLALTLDGAASANDARVGAAEARVPKATKIGDHGTPSIRAVHREETPGKPKIVVDVAAPAGVPVTLFAEGPNNQWALPLPEPVSGAPVGQQRFAFDLDGLPPGEKASGAALRLTAVAGDKAIEAVFRLD